MSRTVRYSLIAAVLCAVLGMPMMIAVPAMVFFNASAAATNPCVNPMPVAGPTGPVRLPVTGAFTVTSEYGMRVNPGRLYYGQYRMHAGLDMAMHRPGSQVVAATGGVVHSTPTTYGGGNTVVIDHGGGIQTRYLHLQSRLVTVGETVWPGKPIGIEGDTGNSQGAHLHFEVLRGGIAHNPRTWLTENGVIVPAPRGAGTAPAAVSAAGSNDLPHILDQPSLFDPAEPAPATNALTSAIPAAVGAWKGEQVVNAAHIIKAGQAMQLDAKTITIGVMTAMGESSLINIDHGDNAGPDSRGLFQQRDNGAWGSYADRMNPTTAATNFYKALIRVPNYLQLEPTIAAHRAQGNADPNHYRPLWGDAVTMVATLTEDPSLLATLPAGGYLNGCDTITDLPGIGDGTGAAIVAAAEHYIGTPYSWGGGDINGPSTGIYTSASLDGSNTLGFDCSGLTMFAVHRGVGTTIPRNSNAQHQDPRAVRIDPEQIQPGDLIAFSDTGVVGTYDHIGIYAGDNEMIHSPKPGKAVERISLKGYYSNKQWTVLRYSNN